jgi:hypothetical protein
MAARIGLLFALLAGVSVPCPGAAKPDGPPASKPSPNAPKDKPIGAGTDKEVDELEKAIAPYIEKARKTYPDAKKRYLSGLPEGQRFFVVTKLKDKQGHFEQVFIAVTRIEGEKIAGRIASNVRTVQGFKGGDAYTFAEGELVDWLIARPDGTEDGNVVGKFLDEWQEKRKE